jgi:aminoglycoside phosphotransferase (APT) family kinase protein
LAISIIQNEEGEKRGAAGRAATPDELRAWIEETISGPVTSWRQIAGGNRCRSWAVDIRAPDGKISPLYLRYQPPRPFSVEPYTIWREALVYRALAGSEVPAPRLIAVHPECQAILTERVPGRADYRRIEDIADRETIACEFVAALAKLHRMSIERLAVPGFERGAMIADCVRREIEIWRAMYEETDQRDPLIDVALDWLVANLPHPTSPPVLVHGDAGPGNFLFENGHLTALLDWELAHAGDPMEDLAWFSMRNVMEPVPDFPARIREYAALSGIELDVARIRYHRVFVSARVVIIRHRNVTGEPGNSIISRALNRRLLVTALAEASAISLSPSIPVDGPATGQTTLFDHVIRGLKQEIADVSGDAGVVAAAKNAAKVLKYLREVDRLGERIDLADQEALSEILKATPVSLEGGKADLVRAMRQQEVQFATVLNFLAGSVAREAQLAASSSGSLATRHFPPLDEIGNVHA